MEDFDSQTHEANFVSFINARIMIGVKVEKKPQNILHAQRRAGHNALSIEDLTNVKRKASGAFNLAQNSFY